MRTLLLFGLFLAGVALYVNSQGGAFGYAPFTPMWYWNYSGQSFYQLRDTGASDQVKVAVSGDFSQGSLRVEIKPADSRPGSGMVRTYSGTFRDTLRYPTQGGLYDVTFTYEDVRGQARLDWVTTKNQY